MSPSCPAGSGCRPASTPGTAAGTPRQGDGEPDRRGGQRQLDQDRLPDGQQPVQAGRRRAHVEPGVGEQQRGPGGGRQAGPRAEERAALDEWRAGQIPGEIALVNRLIRDVRKHGGWAKASRASGYYTAGDLDAFFDEYSELLAKYGHGRHDAPPGARLMQLRMFYIPDEPAGQEP